MTQIFAKRAELMAPGETTDEHQKLQEEDAVAVEQDRLDTGPRGGLFRGCFRAHSRRRQHGLYTSGHPIRDAEDGVDRCPRCTWELEDGICQQCGYPSEDEEWSDSDASEHFHDDDVYGDGDDVESAIIDALVDGVHGAPGFGREYSPASLDYSPQFSERSPFSEDSGLVQELLGPPYQSFHRGTLRREAQPSSQPDTGMADTGTPYDSMQEETDDSSDDEGDVGSLDAFVVDDVDERPHSPANSAGRIFWDSDEGSEAQTQLSGFSDQGHGSQADDESDQNEDFSTSGPAAHYTSEEDSDEGPVPPSRRQLLRRLAVSNMSSGDDNLAPMAPDHRRRRAKYDRGNMAGSTAIRRNIPHHSRNGRTAERRSNGVPIVIDSDSDAPISASQPTRRRQLQAPLSSEEVSGAEVSSGTATIGRGSPRSMRPSQQNSSPNNCPSNEAPPIMIESSPRQTATDDREHSHPYADFSDHFNRSSIPSSGSHPLNDSGLRQRSPDSTNDGDRSSTPYFSPPNHQSPSGRNSRRLSPLPPRSQHRSPASGLPRPTTAQQEFDQGVRQRQVQKAERKAERRRMKAEREQRAARSHSPIRQPPLGLLYAVAT